jgi:hypothetical protein
LNLIKPLNRSVWLHLLRKTKGALTAREHGRTIEAVDAVKNTLDLSNPETAYHYIEEFVPKEEHGEEQVESSGL